MAQIGTGPTMAGIERIGLGTDLHRLEPGRTLVLGGVRFEFPTGLAGHSDGDVVLHAIMDALLGAAGEPDIGEQFPDTDPRWAGADSAALTAEVVRRVHGKGWTVVNLDVVVQAQQPKISPQKEAMRNRIADLLGLAVEAVNVKAKTGEGVDARGRGEATGCQALGGLSRGACRCW